MLGPAGEEEALDTRDAPVGATATFGASACHSIVLLPGEDLRSALAPGSSAHPLRFEVRSRTHAGVSRVFLGCFCSSC